MRAAFLRRPLLAHSAARGSAVPPRQECVTLSALHFVVCSHDVSAHHIESCYVFVFAAWFVGTHDLPLDFAFAGYLNVCMSDQTIASLEIQPTSWYVCVCVSVCAFMFVCRAVLAVLMILNIFRVAAVGWNGPPNYPLDVELYIMLFLSAVIALGYAVRLFLRVCLLVFRHDLILFLFLQTLLVLVRRGINALLRVAGWNGEEENLAIAVQKAQRKLIRRLKDMAEKELKERAQAQAQAQTQQNQQAEIGRDSRVWRPVTAVLDDEHDPLSPTNRQNKTRAGWHSDGKKDKDGNAKADGKEKDKEKEKRPSIRMIAIKPASSHDGRQQEHKHAGSHTSSHTHAHTHDDHDHEQHDQREHERVNSLNTHQPPSSEFLRKIEHAQGKHHCCSLVLLCTCFNASYRCALHAGMLMLLQCLYTSLMIILMTQVAITEFGPAA